MLAIGTPAATSGSQAQADVEVAVNPADAGAVACNAANGSPQLSRCCPAGARAGLAPARQGGRVTHPGTGTGSRSPGRDRLGVARRRDRLEMALIAVAADKGAPGVTTTATALAAGLALARGTGRIADPAACGYRALAARRARRPQLRSAARAAQPGRGRPARARTGQVWQHAQRLRGGLDVLAGVATWSRAAASSRWGLVGDLLARLPGADVEVADCGRLRAGRPVLRTTRPGRHRLHHPAEPG